MRLHSKEDKKKFITVAAKRKKILTNKNGLVMITRGSHQGSNIIDIESVKKYYIVPKDITFKI